MSEKWDPQFTEISRDGNHDGNNGLIPGAIIESDVAKTGLLENRGHIIRSFVVEVFVTNF